MLPRLTLLLAVVYVGSLRAANVVASNNVNNHYSNIKGQQQPSTTSQQQRHYQPSLMMKGGIDVLRRIVNRVKVGGSKSGIVTSCINGVNCAYNSTIVQKQNDEDFGLMKIFESSVKSLMGDDDDGNGDDHDDGDGDDDGDMRNGGENGLEEGRGKRGKKKKGMGKYLVALAAFTKAVLFYIMLHAVAALAGKALIVAKVALAIATAVALKKSLEHKTSYEIVKHPQYSSSHTHSSSVDYDHGGGGYEGGSRRRRRSHR